MKAKSLIAALALLLPAALHAQAEAPSGADLLSQGRTARAIAQLENALGRNPFDPVALNNLAVAYAETGDYRRAAELLQRAQRLAPGDATITENLQATERWLARIAQRAREETERQGEPAEPIRVPPAPPPLWD
jgi:Flp pilus assembly protein TadD